MFQQTTLNVLLACRRTTTRSRCAGTAWRYVASSTPSEPPASRTPTVLPPPEGQPAPAPPSKATGGTRPLLLFRARVPNRFPSPSLLSRACRGRSVARARRHQGEVPLRPDLCYVRCREKSWATQRWTRHRRVRKAPGVDPIGKGEGGEVVLVVVVSARRGRHSSRRRAFLVKVHLLAPGQNQTTSTTSSKNKPQGLRLRRPNRLVAGATRLPQLAVRR